MEMKKLIPKFKYKNEGVNKSQENLEEEEKKREGIWGHLPLRYQGITELYRN